MVMLPKDFEPIIVKDLLVKKLSNGAMAKVCLVRHQGEYKAMLYVNDKQVNGPPIPQPLDNPRDDITHWMGNRPGVGFTDKQAEMIIKTVKERNRQSHL